MYIYIYIEQYLENTSFFSFVCIKMANNQKRKHFCFSFCVKSNQKRKGKHVRCSIVKVYEPLNLDTIGRSCIRGSPVNFRIPMKKRSILNRVKRLCIPNGDPRTYQRVVKRVLKRQS